MSSYRPRRTRIYGASYDIGERYYKNALKDLDNKREPTRQFSLPPPSIDLRSIEDELPPPRVTFSRKFEDDADDEIFNIKSKNALRMKLRAIDSDEDIPSTLIKRNVPKFDAISDGLRFKRDLSLGVDDAAIFGKSSFANENSALDSVATRKIKIRSEKVFHEENSSNEASARAKATKARLANLESDMLSISEKQLEREKRNQHLKKLLADSDV